MLPFVRSGVGVAVRSSSSLTRASTAPRRGGAGMTVTGRLSVSGVVWNLSRRRSACVAAKSSRRSRKSHLLLLPLPLSSLRKMVSSAAGVADSTSVGRRFWNGICRARVRQRLDDGGGFRGDIDVVWVGWEGVYPPSLGVPSSVARLEAVLLLRDKAGFCGGGGVRDVVSVSGGLYLTA